MLAQPTDDERDFFLCDFHIFAIRPETLRVKVLERLAREFNLALAFLWSLWRCVHSS